MLTEVYEVLIGRTPTRQPYPTAVHNPLYIYIYIYIYTYMYYGSYAQRQSSAVSAASERTVCTSVQSCRFMRVSGSIRAMVVIRGTCCFNPLKFIST